MLGKNAAKVKNKTTDDLLGDLTMDIIDIFQEDNSNFDKGTFLAHIAKVAELNK